MLYPVAEQFPALATSPTSDGPREATRSLAPRIERDRGRTRWLQLFQPNTWEWTRIELPIPGLPRGLDGLRIIHLSDVHLRRRWYPAAERLQRQIAHAAPDLILFTGDFVDNRYNCHPAAPNVVRLFSTFRAPLGCFGIFGNHDESRRTSTGLAPYLKDTPVRLIENAREVIELAGAAIELIGLPGFHRTHLKQAFLDSLPLRPANAVRIILSHYPEHVRRTEPLAPDLFLTGHTHGGQCCLPGGSPLITHSRLPRCYAKGLHRWNDQTWLVVNRGWGFSGPPIRAFCPPEVIELALTAA